MPKHSLEEKIKSKIQGILKWWLTRLSWKKVAYCSRRMRNNDFSRFKVSSRVWLTWLSLSHHAKQVCGKRSRIITMMNETLMLEKPYDGGDVRWGEQSQLTIDTS